MSVSIKKSSKKSTVSVVKSESFVPVSFDYHVTCDVPQTADNSALSFLSFMKNNKLVIPGKSERAMIDRVIISSKLSGAGQIDLLLKRENGASLEEMRVFRGAVEAHISALRRKGHNIVCKSNRYYYVPSI